MSRAMLKGVGKVRGGGESGDSRGPWRKVRERLGMSSAIRTGVRVCNLEGHIERWRTGGNVWGEGWKCRGL